MTIRTGNIDSRLDQIIDCLYRVSVKAVIIRNDKILLVQENDHGWWSLPGGGIDRGETINTALQREVSEELNISPERITVHEQVLHAAIGHVVKSIPRVALLYRVDISGNDIKGTDHILGFGWFTSEEVEQLEISDTVGGKTEILRRLRG